MKTLTKIEAVLTFLFVVSLWVMAKMAFWAQFVPDSDTTANLREHRFHLIATILEFAIYWPWIIFTVFYSLILFIYLSSWIIYKMTGDDKT